MSIRWLPLFFVFSVLMAAQVPTARARGRLQIGPMGRMGLIGLI